MMGDYDNHAVSAGHSDVRMKFFLDSCASRHITNVKNVLSDASPSTKTFQVANGDVVTASACGNAAGTTACGKSFSMKDLFFVLDCPANLLSIPELARKGIKTSMGTDGGKLVFRDGTAIPVKFSGNNFFIELSLR